MIIVMLIHIGLPESDQEILQWSAEDSMLVRD